MRRIVKNVALVLLALAFVVCLTMFIYVAVPGMQKFFVSFLDKTSSPNSTSNLAFKLLVYLILIGIALYFIVRTIGTRLKLRDTDIGGILVSTDALETIALNSAKTAQSGIKTARARVRNTRRQLFVRLYVNIYSDVEIPVLMARVQERVKKDLEHYSGLPVESVEVKVQRVEEIAARVER